jgi:molybdenum cofactor cytidylyltransferase
MGNIGAVILAAGESKRLGRCKQLLQFRGKSLIRRVVDEALAAKCRPVVVILAADQPPNEQIRNELRGAEVALIDNGAWRLGIGTSIRAGVNEIMYNPEVSAVLLLTCDQPFVDAPLLDHLKAAYERTKKPVVASAYDGTLGVPALFDRSCFDELLQLGDNEGAKKLILREPARMRLVLFPDGAIDIDTPADFRRLAELDRDAQGRN